MTQHSYNQELANLVKQWLDAEDFHYNFDEELGRFDYGVQCNTKFNQLRCIIGIGETYIVFYYICPLHATSEQLASIAEFITRANYGLTLGCFELDFNDGEIRYRMTANCDGILPSPAILNDCFILPINMFERYGDALASVLLDFSTAKEAIEKVENRYHDNDDNGAIRH